MFGSSTVLQGLASVLQVVSREFARFLLWSYTLPFPGRPESYMQMQPLAPSPLMAVSLHCRPNSCTKGLVSPWRPCVPPPHTPTRIMVWPVLSWQSDSAL